MSQNRIIIAIPAFNEEAILEKTLTSIQEQCRPPVKCMVVVVANACTDSTVNVALAFGRRHWLGPQQRRCHEVVRWDFQEDMTAMSYGVIETPVPGKSNAMNLVHDCTVDGDIVVAIDADVHVGQGTINAIHSAFIENPRYGAVAVRYQGHIPHLKRRWCLTEELRVAICNAINHFDNRLPRLDGKCFAYRHSLIYAHPRLTAADTWLEGIAWRDSAGCIYLQQPVVQYVFPNTLKELFSQYLRYAKSASDLAMLYPKLPLLIRRGRLTDLGGACATLEWRYRMIGWIFFTFVRAFAWGFKFGPGSVSCGDTWRQITSSKKAWSYE